DRAAAALAFTPPPPGVPIAAAERAALVACLVARRPAYPPLLEEGEDRKLRFPQRYLEKVAKDDGIRVERVEGALPRADDRDALLRQVDRGPLDSHKVDLLLVVPSDFQEQLERSGQAELFVLTREKDESARLVEL